jgi:hypothetical protein
MTRKYYKNGLTTDAISVIVEFRCPNTNEITSVRVESYQLAGVDNEMGSSMVSAYVKCEECNKMHYINLKD